MVFCLKNPVSIISRMVAKIFQATSISYHLNLLERLAWAFDKANMNHFDQPAPYYGLCEDLHSNRPPTPRTH
jgi:hypothetical protein